MVDIKNMNFQVVFYVIGIIFLFAATIFFSYEYIFNLSQQVKAMLLFLLVIVFFFFGEYLRSRRY